VTAVPSLSAPDLPAAAAALAPPEPAALARPTAADTDTFLVASFREFYRELLVAKERALGGRWRGAAESAGTPQDLWRHLLSILERQALDAGRIGGDIGAELYRQAQYVMAALADDTFLHLRWPGREGWTSNLLEARLFGTHRAGEEVFDRLERLLRERDSAYVELGRVYLLALALGFEGKLRGRPEGPALLAAFRRSLYRFIHHREPRVVRGEEVVVPQTYAATFEGSEPRRLPYLRRWVVAAVVVVALWVVGGHIVWRHLVSGLEPLVQRILVQPEAPR
jgi:type VI secretion system protein ImpK